MLVQFSVENFLSFKEKTTFSMVASKDANLSERVVKGTGERSMNLLNGAVVFGPNASGKSNFVKAFSFARRFVMESAPKRQEGELTGRVPFKISIPTRSLPSLFEVAFLNDNKLFEYQFSLDDKYVINETLAIRDTSQRKRKVFDRVQIPNSRISNYTFGRNWEKELKRLVAHTRENALFLSAAAQWNVGFAIEAVAWFTSCLIIEHSRSREDVASALTLSHDSIGRSRTSSEYLRMADTGIERIFVSSPYKKFLEKMDAPTNIEEEPTTTAVKKSKKKDGKRAEPSREVGNELMGSRVEIERLLKKTGLHRFDVAFLHAGEDRHKDHLLFFLEIDEESDGTIALLDYSIAWEDALTTGGIVVIDEFDSRLHPLLSRWLINRFMDPARNTRHAQLILTTHNTNLLDSTLFRRDQIWFTEKENSGATRLYSLWDFLDESGERPRKDESAQKRYLQGRYGAIPILNEL